MEGGSHGGRALGVTQASAPGFHGDYVPGTGMQTHWLGWAATPPTSLPVAPPSSQGGGGWSSPIPLEIGDLGPRKEEGQ